MQSAGERESLMLRSFGENSIGKEILCKAQQCRSYCANKVFSSSCKKLQFRQQCERDLVGQYDCNLNVCSGAGGLVGTFFPPATMLCSVAVFLAFLAGVL